MQPPEQGTALTHFFSASLRFLNLPSEDTSFCSLSIRAFVCKRPKAYPGMAQTGTPSHPHPPGPFDPFPTAVLGAACGCWDRVEVRSGC